MNDTESTTAIRCVAIAAKKASAQATSLAAELSEWLRRRSLGVVLEDHLHECDELTGQLWDPSAEIDLMIVLGGDGTLLSVARRLSQDVPILGVNLGSLGFLTEINRAELYPSLVKVLEGRFSTEQRTLFDLEVQRADGSEVVRYRALNDVVVNKSALARMIQLKVRVDEHLTANYRSDGLIVSTPTGSTAYNLSAGGPILAPDLPVVILTPICPHTLSLRPLVVSDASTIDVTLATADEEVYLTVDGQEGTTLSRGDRVVVRAAADRTTLVKVSGRNYYDSLRSKLGWGE